MASLVVVDTYFRESGHGLTLGRTLQRELAKLGLQTVMLVPRSFASLQPDFHVEASLPLRTPADGLASRLPYWLRLFWSLLRRSWPAGATVFWPIVAPDEMIAAGLLSLFKGRRLPQVFLLQIAFRQQGHDPGRFRSFTRADRLNRLLGWKWRFIPSTQAVAADYAAIGVRAIEAPIDISYHQGHAGPAATDPCTLVYLGEARDNKGFHLAMDLALKLRSQAPGRFRFAYQVHAQEDQPAPLTADCLRRLAAAGSAGLELHYGRLSEQQYMQLLEQATFVLLPCDPAVYSHLPSGICSEAFAAGRPVIASRGTWTGKLVERNGCGVLFDYSRPQQLLEAADQAWKQRAVLVQRAWQHRAGWREERTPEHFARRLLGLVPGAAAGMP